MPDNRKRINNHVKLSRKFSRLASLLIETGGDIGDIEKALERSRDEISAAMREVRKNGKS